MTTVHRAPKRARNQRRSTAANPATSRRRAQVREPPKSTITAPELRAGEISRTIEAELETARGYVACSATISPEWTAAKRQSHWSSVEQTYTATLGALEGFAGGEADRLRESAEAVRRDLWKVRESFARESVPRVKRRKPTIARYFAAVRELAAVIPPGFKLSHLDTPEGQTVLAVNGALEAIADALDDFDRWTAAGCAVGLRFYCNPIIART